MSKLSRSIHADLKVTALEALEATELRKTNAGFRAMLEAHEEVKAKLKAKVAALEKDKARLESERDKLKALVFSIIESRPCESRECGGCEDDSVPLCDDYLSDVRGTIAVFRKGSARLDWYNLNPLAIKFTGTEEKPVGFWLVVCTDEIFDDLDAAIDAAMEAK